MCFYSTLWFSCCTFRLCFRFCLPRREVDLKYGARRAFSHAFPAESAFVGIDVRQVICYCYCTELAHIEALAACYAGYLTGSPGRASLIAVLTGYIDLTVFFSFLTEFQEVTRTCFDTGSAGSTLIVDDLRQPGNRINMKGIEGTSSFTVSVSQASIAAVGLSKIQAVSYTAIGYSVILCVMRSEFR